jgi:Bacteriocin-protection, YdeI or OmpD-Associated/Domain of unknown function (DUF1905)
MPVHRFSARLYRIGLLRCIDIPVHASRALGPGLAPPVRGTIEGVAFRSTLRPRGQGAYRLYVHSRAWRPRGLDAGDDVRVAIERDEEPREQLDLPADFLRALDDRPLVRAFVATMAPSLRREIAAWLAAARRVETRERRIAVALDRLEERAEQRARRARPRNLSANVPAPAARSQSARPSPAPGRRKAKVR